MSGANVVLPQKRPDQATASRLAMSLATAPLVLLASDGSEPSAAAARLAVALGRERGMRVRVLTVLAPELYPPPVMNLDTGNFSPEATEDHTVGRVRAIRSQIADEGSAQPEWPMEIEVGPPATIIVRDAHRHRASMVLMGLRHHRAIARILRDETTLRVVRQSTVPVLAVTPALTELPARVAVGMDFSRASLRAARAAISVCASNATLYLVYVRPEAISTEETEGLGVIFSQGVSAAFGRLRQELAIPRGMSVEPVVLHGEAAPELLNFANRASMDLITVGSHRHPFLSRILIGSVTTTLVRDAQHSLLVAPPSPPAGAG